MPRGPAPRRTRSRGPAPSHHREPRGEGLPPAQREQELLAASGSSGQPAGQRAARLDGLAGQHVRDPGGPREVERVHDQLEQPGPEVLVQLDRVAAHGDEAAGTLGGDQLDRAARGLGGRAAGGR